MIHVMVDLETWGTTPGSDIRSIGAVAFDPIVGTMGAEFYVNVENRYWDDGGYCMPGSQMKHPLTRDPATEAWWADQSQEAQQILLVDQQELKIGLMGFADWLHRLMPQPCEHPTLQPIQIGLWAHGPHFDEAILAACYRACGVPVPWNHRSPRDCRTIWEAAGGIDIPFEGIEHYALDDAKHQARCVIEAYKRLRPSNTRVSELLRYNSEQVELRRAADRQVHELASAARRLREAQRAYLADRGNELLGVAVGLSAADLDEVLSRVTPA